MLARRKMAQKNTVCCIIVNWNTPGFTQSCLDSLKSQVPPLDTIIVCDNASTDDSNTQICAWARQVFPEKNAVRELTARAVDSGNFPQKQGPPKFVFIQNSSNQGFARGNNLGIKWALAQKIYSYIWLLNPDTFLEKGALHALLLCGESRQSVGIWGSTVCLAHQPDTLQCAAGYTYTAWSSVIRPFLGGVSLKPALKTPVEPSLGYIFGASMFIKTRLLQEIGYLSEAYFLFYEELDLCSRARQAGYELGWCRQSIVYHHGGTGFESQTEADDAELCKITYHETLSTFIFTRKFYPHLLPLVLLIRVTGKFFCLAPRRQTGLMRPVLRACRDFLKKKGTERRYKRF